MEFGRGIFSYAQTTRIRQYGAKIDQHFSDRDILAGRFLIDDKLVTEWRGDIIVPELHHQQYFQNVRDRLDGNARILARPDERGPAGLHAV